MSQVYRERDVRYTRDESPSSDDEKYKSTTVRRYKVAGGKSGNKIVERDRIERYEEDDDRRSRYSHSHKGRSPDEVVEVDRIDRRIERTPYPDPPRSAFDPPDRYRDFEYEREVDRERDQYPERHSRTRVVEEIKETSTSPRDNYWDRRQNYPWDDTDVRLDKRVVRRDGDGDVKIKEKTVEEHRDDSRDYRERDWKVERRVVEEREPPRDVDVERYRKEVEYYAAPSPPPAPVIIRQKAPEQKVVIHEAAAPAPVFLPRQEPTYIVLRDEHREVAPPRREEEEHHRRRRDEREYESDGYDEDYYVKRTIIRRDRSSSADHKKRHLAEGALAGAGLTALLSGRGNKDTGYHEHRGRKVLAGAALGALGTEAMRRAKSAYEDRHDDRYEDDYDDGYHHHRQRSKSRSRLATGLAIGAAALAVAGGLKYMQNNKIEKEEAHRGRARRRYSADSYSRSPSRSSRRSRSRSKSNSKAAKAALATSALAGVVEHYRSKSRGKSRSKSRLRTGAEIAAAGLTGAAASKIWDRHNDKKEREHDRELDEEYSDRDHDRGYSRSRSRSHSRSLSRHSRSRDSTADKELGLVPYPGVEYGSQPLEDHESASGEPRRRTRHRRRSTSATSDRETRKKRSRSTLRDVAAAGLGTAAAAIGLKKYNDRQKSKEREKDREKDREDKGYEEEAPNPYYYGDEVPPSPPHASGGAYYPPPPQEPTGPPPAGPGGFMYHPNPSTTNFNAYPPHQPYDPRDYINQSPMNLPPPPPGPPPSGPPPPGSGNRPGPENVSRPRSGDIQSHPDASRSPATEQDGLNYQQRSRSPSPSPKEVKFGPLSPKSPQTLRRHRRTLSRPLDEDAVDEELARLTRPRNSRQRSGSEPHYDRPRVQRRRRRGDQSPASDDGDVEYLPDRFDPSGRPLDNDTNTLSGIPRQGSFEYLPRDDNDWHIRGAWRTLGNPDPTLVSELAQTFGGLLQPRGGLLGMLGHALKEV
ncbi:uncharacterized protein F4807DRAFT_458421 [Annulohypoxylon truncatum]|uniref:uncharacterized protein n=1 Tax=Annulohypoxylon truncatum TaxID=327061 RepID=UPI00200778B5|nr:uncharacterized protein F4807DRAFT_458421 [Annulohypoxylon truncatum]KAI1211526.1 hypothetical protein F4807DRAFT_458421 [Annulohypoxylon truncatum]